MFLSLSKLVEIALQKVEFSCGLFRYQSSIVAYLAVRKLGSLHNKQHSFRAEKDGGYEHVPSCNLFCGLYQYHYF